MVYVLGILGILTGIGLVIRMFRNNAAYAKGQKEIKKMQNDPARLAESLPKLVHRCWYVNMENIPKWDTAIRNMPEKFMIGGIANVNHWQIVNENEVVMVVVAHYTVIGGRYSNRTSSVPVEFTFNAHIRPNMSTGNYEMRTTIPDGTEEKNTISAFGRKFFEALQGRQ